ncbi:hypothetical protein [Nocardia sp. NPDC052566]|uniref:hypothetical protein n=1 Tax=Nocardia sp. NPDC052566 TaxID=3364330 RepID=UPI0037C740DB
MDKPTRAQARVLKHLQNQSVELHKMIAAATERTHTGETVPQTWYEHFHGRAVLHEELQRAAVAAGIPRTWIDHVKERGERNVRWRKELYLRAPEPVDRPKRLAALGADVQRLREWTTVHAAYPGIGGQSEAATASDVDRALHALWARSAAVAHILGVTREEAETLWGTTQNWVDTANETIAGIEREQPLSQRWRDIANADTLAYALQAVALKHAGITAATPSAPPDTAETIPRIRAVLNAATAASVVDTETPRIQTNAAIEAAFPTFSDPIAEPNPHYNIWAEIDSVAPEFSSAAGPDLSP